MKLDQSSLLVVTHANLEEKVSAWSQKCYSDITAFKGETLKLGLTDGELTLMLGDTVLETYNADTVLYENGVEKTTVGAVLMLNDENYDGIYCGLYGEGAVNTLTDWAFTNK